MKSQHRIFSMSFATVYVLYVQKIEKKGRTKEEVNTVICWLTGYSQDQLDDHLEDKTTFDRFFDEAPRMHPHRVHIRGVICGVRIENMEEGTMKEIRYLDKLVDEIAKGRPMNKILRGSTS